jgi:hypothetical protein
VTRKRKRCVTFWIRCEAHALCFAGDVAFYRRTEKREQAQGHLVGATTMYRQMGMTYWLEKAESEMRD